MTHWEEDLTALVNVECKKRGWRTRWEAPPLPANYAVDYRAVKLRFLAYASSYPGPATKLALWILLKAPAYGPGRNTLAFTRREAAAGIGACPATVSKALTALSWGKPNDSRPAPRLVELVHISRGGKGARFVVRLLVDADLEKYPRAGASR